MMVILQQQWHYLFGLVGSETLGQSVTAAFNKNKKQENSYSKAITLSDGSNGGVAGNYTVSTGQTTTANITAKALTVSGITASNKTYDANTNATTDVTSAVYTGLVSGDNFVVSATGTFDNKNVGTGKTVTLSSSYSGSVIVSNYSVTDQSSTTANITAKARQFLVLLLQIKVTMFYYCDFRYIKYLIYWFSKWW